MIVTCPSCTAQYRVRDESVPHGGATLQCPECATRFVAMPPASSSAAQEVTSPAPSNDASAQQANPLAAQQEVDRLRSEFLSLKKKADAAENERASLQKERDALKERSDRALQQFNADKERLTVELRGVQQKADEVSVHEARVVQLSKDLTTAQKDLGMARQELTASLETVRHCKRQIEAAEAAQQKQADEIARLHQQLAQGEGEGAKRADPALETRLEAAQKATGKLMLELEHIREERDVLLKGAQKEASLPAPTAPTAPAATSEEQEATAQLQKEVARLRQQLKDAIMGGSGSFSEADLPALVAAVTPLLWGLHEAVEYIEPFAAGEPILNGHSQQLRLLLEVLNRLAASPQV